MSPSQTHLITVTEEEAGQRLDKLLFERYRNEQSRSYFQRLIREERVLVNGKLVKKQLRPNVGDEVEVEFTLTPEIDLTPEAIPLDIIFEDEHLIVVNKPAGMVVHPAPGNWSGTFVNALLYHCSDTLAKDATLRPGIVHRLDKETSGCLVAAKNMSVQRGLIELFSNRKVHKEYLAICVGNPGKGTVDAPIGRHPRHRKKMAIIETGRKAVTHFSAVAVSEKLSLVRVVLETGRTHQIRVHMADKGTPILGDSTYGSDNANRFYKPQRQLLHAHKLSFVHPVTGDDFSVTAPLPEDFEKVVNTIDPKVSLSL